MLVASVSFISMMSCGTTPISEYQSLREISLMSTPSTVTVPSCGSSDFSASLNSVVLPDPVSPTRKLSRPRWAVKLTSETTVLSP